MNIQPIKVGILLAFDYELIKTLLPTIYPYADNITIAIEANNKTWTGGTFEIDPSIFQWIQAYDSKNKISIIRDEFYSTSRKPMECENYARDCLTKALGSGGWHIQLDSDEYFVDFCNFVSFLHKLEFNTHCTVYANLQAIFKKIDAGYLVVSEPIETFPVATNNPIPGNGRKHPNKKTIFSPYLVVHNSWGRSKEEIWKKINNWGHTSDFQINEYYQFWLSVNEYNYKYLRSFHPVYSEIWNKLLYFHGESVVDILAHSPSKIQSENRVPFYKVIFLSILPPFITAWIVRIKQFVAGTKKR